MIIPVVKVVNHPTKRPSLSRKTSGKGHKGKKGLRAAEMTEDETAETEA